MGWKIIFSIFFILFAVALLVLYWFVPIGTNIFTVTSGNSNFTAVTNSSLQFYPNMRYPDSRISYSIENSCTLQKKNEMERAFQIMNENTLLNFYNAGSNGEISVTCEDTNKVEGRLFIAGEGGPTNITVAGEYNVIFNGQIILIRNSNCANPNIAIHELLHTLGFDHSTNPNNIMYPVTSCDQTIGDDIISLINKLYSVPSYPDLILENVSAVMRGRYLDLSFDARNGGLKNADSSKVIIYADGDSIKTVEINPIQIGAGRGITLTNIWTKKRNVENLTLVIDSGSSELDFQNNKVTLQVKD